MGSISLLVHELYMPFVYRWLDSLIDRTTNELFATVSFPTSNLAQMIRFVGLCKFDIDRDRSRKPVGLDCWSLPRGWESSTKETTRTSPIAPREAPFFVPTGLPPHPCKLSSSSVLSEAHSLCGGIQKVRGPRGGAGVQPWFFSGFRL